MEVSNTEEDLFNCFEEDKKELKRKKTPKEKKNRKEKNIPKELTAIKESDESIKEIIFEDSAFKEISLPKIINVPCGMGCTHEAAISSNIEYKSLIYSDEPPSKEYPFVLDDFQKQAILCIDNNQSVLVSAHTSSGKTVVAEYAIAKCLKNHQRVIYTSPIKALSNQKFRELNEEFRDVGLQTGDVTINPNASCVVMTTEILRSMLYRGSEIIREVAWVIFDEIHYMRDKERGVVWEETIIMLPDNVRYVFLSATIPNARQFAEWVAVTHSQSCHVICTDYRPTPLQHYIYPSTGDSMYLIVDEKGQFKDKHAQEVLGKNDSKSSSFSSRTKINTAHSIVRLSKFMVERKFYPVIIFSFSKKECEYYALAIMKMDFNDQKEHIMVDEVFSNALESLSEEDKKLPQVTSSLHLLKRGIGIHHSGLLPLLKEVTEILFSEGLIKFLFATETFAMGLNMPARTVVFTTCSKYDGVENRYLQSGEYIQMSGRAGRRGIDDRGICILMLDDQTPIKTLKSILSGSADPLNSAFRLTYNMILNLLRIEGINPEHMMQKCFYQHQLSSRVPEIIEKYKELKNQLNQQSISNNTELQTYVKLTNELTTLQKEQAIFLANPKTLLPFLQPGRLLRIKTLKHDFGWGCIVRIDRNCSIKAIIGDKQQEMNPGKVYVLLNCIYELIPGSNKMAYTPCNDDKNDSHIIPVSFHLLTELGAVRIQLPQDMKEKSILMSVINSIKDVEKKFPDGIPLLDPIKDMKINDTRFLELHELFLKLHDRIECHPIHIKLQKKPSKIEGLINEYKKKLDLVKQLDELKTELKDVRAIVKLNDLKARKRVLRRLGFIDSSDMIEVKGRVACEISCADELVLTELLFSGFFNEISHNSICAVLSCFLYQEKSYDGVEGLSKENQQLFTSLIQTVTRVAKVSKDCRLALDIDNYVSSFKNDLMQVFYDWANGSNFEAICAISDVFEGSIIRCLRRLEELLKQLINAAKCIGNAELEK
ncbi:hypothetical protein HZS_1505, partial [Henneguya salminicola]